MFISIEASLFLTREFPQDESIKDEDVMYSFSTYIAENAESLNLVEGKKVFVLGKLISHHKMDNVDKNMNKNKF